MPADRSRSMEATTTSDVAEYYDRNTRRFLLMGSGVPSMHRALWAPGEDSPERAIRHVDTLLANTIAGFALGSRPTVFDFGCGVGGTLFHLAERFPDARLTGVTLSPKQLRIAERLAREGGVADRCAFVLGDFQSVDLGSTADVVVAVESFAHSTSAPDFLDNVARHLRVGGRLIVVDDFLAADESVLSEGQRARVAELRTGWRLPALCTVEGLTRHGARHGLSVDVSHDLTSLTRPGSRLRDRLTGFLSPLVARMGLVRMPFYGNLIGGNALQIGLREGFVRYQLLVFEKAGR
ncbi:MAG: methyltransferase domain-containing protein [Gemmatimonadetes bacterium]|nr:methyltransferase domain-containing protein [Gemmatimonadota bacterium]